MADELVASAPTVSPGAQDQLAFIQDGPQGHGDRDRRYADGDQPLAATRPTRTAAEEAKLATLEAAAGVPPLGLRVTLVTATQREQRQPALDHSTAPSGSRRRRASRSTCSLGALLGLLVMIAIAFTWETVDDRSSPPRTSSEVTGLATVGADRPDARREGPQAVLPARDPALSEIAGRGGLPHPADQPRVRLGRPGLPDDRRHELRPARGQDRRRVEPRGRVRAGRTPRDPARRRSPTTQRARDVRPPQRPRPDRHDPVRRRQVRAGREPDRGPRPDRRHVGDAAREPGRAPRIAAHAARSSNDYAT